MAIVGEAHVIVKAITVGFNQQVQQALNGLNSTGAQAGQSIGKAFSNGAASGMSKADAAAKSTYQSINKLIEGGYYLQSAITAAAGAIAVLAGGLFALGSQVAAATPALIVLPSIFSAMAQAAIAGKLAFSGIAKAVGALTKAKAGGAISQLPALLTAAKAAEDRLTDSKYRAKKAEEALAKAREDAREDLEQLAFSAEGAALAEKRAAMELEKARKTLARVQDLPPNSAARKEAELGYQEAELAYRKAKDNNADTAAEQKKQVALGVEGSDKVTNALHDQEMSVRAVKDAIDAQAIAAKKLKDAQSGRGGGGGADPLAGLTPEAAEFAKFIADLKPKIDELKSAVGKTLFPPLEIAIDNLVKNLFPSLKTILAETGVALGQSAIDFSKIVTEADNLKNLNTVAGTNKDTIGKLGKVTGNLYSVFLSLMSAADPLVRRFTDWTVALTGGWKETVEAKNKTGELTDTFNTAGDIAAQLGRIIGNIGGAFLNMGKAASGPGSGGQMIFDFLEQATAKFKTFTEVGLKDGSLEEYFRSVADSFNKVLHILGVVSGAILKTGDDKGTSDFFTSLSKGAEVLAGALTTLSEGGVSGSFGKFIERMAEFLAATSESGSIKVYFGILNTALGLLNTVLSNPIAGKILGMAAAAHGAKTAFNRLGSTLKKAREYIQGSFEAMQDGVSTAKRYGTSIKNVAGNFSAARSMGMGYFQSLKMTLGYTKLGAAATKAWTGVQAAFNAVMAMNPIALVVIAIVALIAVVVVMYMKFEWFRDFVQTVWELMLSGFTLAWEGIKAVFTVVWDFIKGAIELYWNFYMKPIFDLMLTVFKLAWDGIKIAFNLVWDFIKGAITFVWDNVIKPVFQAFGTVFGKVWDGIKTAFTGAWDFIKSTIDGAKTLFGKIGTAIVDTFKSAINFIIRAWNNLEFKVPGVEIFGKKIGGFTLGLPNIPELANGGVIRPTPGGTLARIGEAGRSERVEPLDADGLSTRDKAMITLLAGGRGGGINVVVNPAPGMDEVELAALVSRQIAFQLRRGAA